MPLLLWQAYAWLGSGWFAILPLLKKVPWQVWAGIAAVIAILYYGHVRENRGYARCQAAVKVATDKEIARQAQVSEDVLAEASKRAKVAEDNQLEAQRNAAELQKEVDKLKTAKTVCLPGSITKRYRN